MYVEALMLTNGCAGAGFHLSSSMDPYVPVGRVRTCHRVLMNVNI